MEDDQRKGRVGAWVQGLRLYSVSTSLLPTVMGLVLLPRFDWVLWGLIAGCVLLAHAGTNMINDYYDFLYGVDRRDTESGSRVLVDGLLEPIPFRNAALGCFGVSALLGLGVVLYTGRWALLLFGLFCLPVCYFYTATKTLQLKRYGLGDLGVMTTMGPLTTGGIYYAGVGVWSPVAFLVGLVPGLLAVLVLQTNNLRDVKGDQDVGLRNLGQFGKLSFGYWWLVLALAYGVQLLLVFKFGLSVWTLVTLAGLFFLRPRAKVELIAMGHMVLCIIVAAGLWTSDLWLG